MQDGRDGEQSKKKKKKMKELPNMAKYKAKLQPRGGCELSKSRAKLLGAFLLKGVGQEKE